MADNTIDTIAQLVEVQGFLTKFTLFPKLPNELRLKIFKLALSIGPRGLRLLKVAIDNIVSVTSSKVETSLLRMSEAEKNESKVDGTTHLTFRLLDYPHNIHIKDLGLLGACSESRGVYLEHFSLSLRAADEGLIHFAEGDIIYIANIWKCVRHAKLRNVLKAGFESIPCRKLAFPIHWFFDERLESWVRADEIFDKNLLEVISHGQLLKEIGVIIGDWKTVVEETPYDEWLVNNGIYAEGWLLINGRDPEEMDVIPHQGRPLDWADTIRRQWELCEELRDCKLPEVCVWDMNGERYRRAKREA